MRFCYQEASSFTVHSVRNTAKSCDPIFMLVPSKYFSFEKKTVSVTFLFKNPFDSAIENLPSDLHTEVSDLQSSDISTGNSRTNVSNSREKPC